MDPIQTSFVKKAFFLFLQQIQLTLMKSDSGI